MEMQKKNDEKRSERFEELEGHINSRWKQYQHRAVQTSR